MFTPHSVLADSWTSLDGYASKIFKDDFCHDSLLTWKVKSVTTGLAALRFKEKLNYDGKAVRATDELKLWFPVRGSSTHVFVKTANHYAKLHADFGVTEINGQRFNYYGSIEANKNGADKIAKLGIQNIDAKCNSDTRLRLEETKNAQLQNRTYVRHGNWRLGLLGVLNLNDLRLVKKDLTFGYASGEYEGYLKAEQAWANPTNNWKDITQWFTKFSLQGVWRRNFRESYALQVELDPQARKLGDVTALVEYNQNPNNGLKVKLNDKLNLSFVLKRVHNSQFAGSLGASIPLAADFRNASKVGIQIEANV